MILGIDTSAGQCAVALIAWGGDGPVRRSMAMERGHSDHLFGLVDAVLIAAGAVPSDLTAVAVCTGPGSFTGLRVGIAAARGFAMGLGVPAIGITRFEALAAGHDGPVAVVLRGRQQTVYLQMFDAAGVAAGPATMLSVDSLPSVIPSGLPVIGDHGPLAGPALADPATVARLAQGRGAGPLPAPLYLRGPDADLPRTAPPAILVP